MQPELAGAAAGFAATAPMTAAMKLMHAMLPHDERYPLPPRQIVDNAVGKADVEQATPGESHNGAERHTGLEPAGDHRAAIALAAHFAFGAMAGSAYGSIARARPAHPAVAGAAYGLLVWVSQYVGVLPTVGMLSNAKHHPARRNALMIAAHLVWGAALGVLAERLVSPSCAALTCADGDPEGSPQRARKAQRQGMPDPSAPDRPETRPRYSIV